MSTVKCPKCRKPIPFEATTHAECGWNVAVSAQNPYTPASEPRTPEQRDGRGLRRVEDAIREVVTTGKRRDPHGWARSIVRDYRDGKHHIPIALAMACKVLRIDPAEL